MGWVFRTFLVLLPVLLLAACGHGGGPATGAYGGYSYAPTHYYAPPGPPDDPWGPYIDEAAARFSIPGQWIRAVMAQESGGEEQAVSSAGAIGLMQVMPDTYAELQAQYGLGNDPFDPEQNILAGAAYIREMYDKYGAPGFLAAYNAGPERVDEYLAGNENLPDETVNYLAAVTPNLGDAVAFSGPLAAYAVAGVAPPAPSAASFATGCDVDAAYDPDHPCTAPAGAAPVEVASAVPAAASGGCDADTAYDPANPCTVARAVEASAVYQPAPAPPPAPVVAAAPVAGAWGIQVGAFASAGLARAVAEGARTEAPEWLGDAGVALPETTPFGGNVLYQARLVNLSRQAAADACSALNRRQLPCVVVQPGSS